MNNESAYNNYDSTYNSDSQNQMPFDQMGGSIAFILLAVTMGIVIALLVAGQQRRKPKTFREKLEYNIGKSGEATANAVKQLSKDITELRKSVEERLESMR
jgi:hypothetical protein